MADYKVTGVNLEGGDRDGGRIVALCGEPTFNWSVEEVIRRIENKEDTFYVHPDGGSRAEVSVKRQKDGRPPFVTTNPDDSTKDNLRKLTRSCP